MDMFSLREKIEELQNTPREMKQQHTEAETETETGTGSGHTAPNAGTYCGS